jgi:hypothetical protein
MGWGTFHISHFLQGIREEVDVLSHLSANGIRQIVGRSLLLLGLLQEER